MNTKHESEGSPTEVVAQTAIDMVTQASLPAPVRKNALKAFDQLCAALVDIPVAYLEGVAQSKRAENAARTDLIRQTGSQIQSNIDVDPEYARAAATKFAEKIVRERRSIDRVASIAALQLANINEDAQAQSGEEISPDWINNFETEASQKSSSEMQQLFGSILAGEITKPGSFSIRAVKILGQMDSRAAKLFQKLCSTSISLQLEGRFFDARVASLGGHAAQNALSKYGLSFDNLNTLQEYGLIIPELHSWMDYCPAVAQNGKVTLGITHAGQVYGLVPKPDRTVPTEFKINGVMLTKAGRELMTVVPLMPDEIYTKDLMAYFDASGFTVAEARAR